MARERTPEEIQKQIEWLKSNKKKVPQYSAFGEDNWAKIDIEIEVLTENLDEDECMEKQESGEWDDSQFEAARDILQWRDEMDDSAAPDKNWGGLIHEEEPTTMPQPVKGDPAKLGEIVARADEAVKKAKLTGKPKFSPKPVKRAKR